MSEAPLVSLRADGIAADIAAEGAELQALRDGAGRDLLWDGDPAWWTGRAPILFPVIGLVNGGVVHVDGTAYPMPKHGFARHSRFAVVEQEADRVAFRLTDGPETRAAYPFPFVLTLRYALADRALTVEALIDNPGDRPLPASFGFHPALRWPLPYGGDRDAHRVRFDAAEPGPIRRIGADGLLTPAPHPTPVEGRTLVPRDALFTDDALIFLDPASRGVAYGVPGRPGLRLRWEALPDLGIWTKPGAPFLCIEPWQGHSDPEGYAGDLADKPGIVRIAPGATHRLALTIALSDDPFA